MLAQISNALLSYATLAAMVIGPFIAFAVVIHFLERMIQKRLAERFGWSSVMWTGWLGTPIHELSHAAMCKIFGIGSTKSPCSNLTLRLADLDLFDIRGERETGMKNWAMRLSGSRHS